MITEVCSLPQILKSPLGLRVAPLELPRRLQYDRHDSGFYKCLFQNMRVPSGLSWGIQCACGSLPIGGGGDGGEGGLK